MSSKKQQEKDPETQVESSPRRRAIPPSLIPLSLASPRATSKPRRPTRRRPRQTFPSPKREALSLFRAGHKLRKAGDPPEKWFQASRIGGILVLCVPVDQDVEEAVLDQDLVLAD